jgi:8-oxo-dGTP pyrophosphatase MutT (NUDIX family)
MAKERILLRRGIVQMSLMMRIETILRNRLPNLIDTTETHYAHASVLVPIFKEGGEHKILFTKRSTKVENHRGQISFPGGVVEKRDGSWEETALREAKEEIGLSEEDVKILGPIDDATTLSSRFIIHPFVGRIPFPYDFQLNPYEVQRLVSVPLRLLMGNGLLKSKGEIALKGISYHTPVIEYQGEKIWGATANITENFVEIVRGKLDLPDG